MFSSNSLGSRSLLLLASRGLAHFLAILWRSRSLFLAFPALRALSASRYTGLARFLAILRRSSSLLFSILQRKSDEDAIVIGAFFGCCGGAFFGVSLARCRLFLSCHFKR